MKQDWTEQMRNKLEGHEQTPPAGLWEAVSEQMGLTPAPKRRPLIPVRWWWGVAAAVAVLIVVLAPPSPPSGGKLVAESAPLQSRNTIRQVQPTTQQREKRKEEIKEQTEEHHIEEQTEEQTEEHIEEQIEEQIEEHIEEQASLHPTDVSDAPSTPNFPPKGGAGGARRGQGGLGTRGFSLALEGSGLLAAAQTLHREERIYYTPANYFAAPGNDPYGTPVMGERPIYSLTDYAAKHHPPVRFGLQLQYRPTSRLTLSTGLSYTYLHSQFTIPLHGITIRDQHLHYLGLPLGLGYQLWGNRHFQVYMAATAMVEKCLNDSPWQWSVRAAAGAEYRFHRLAGLYLEPSFGYYFDDGTDLQHYYKQHPAAPAIEVGLRLHFKN